MRAEETTKDDDPPGPAEAATPELRVLVADDSAVTRRVMSALVSTIVPEVEIVEASTGADTCEELRRSAFDVAFVDFHMPDMSGPRAVSLARRVGVDPFVVMMGDSAEDAADYVLRTIALTSSCRNRSRSASCGRSCATRGACAKPFA